MKKLRVGSRESRLAVIQSEKVINEIKKYYPEYETELVTMKTSGDKVLDKALDKIGGKGLFVKELDNALLEGRIDIAVHSLKDMPWDISDELPIIGYMKRENPFDALVLPRDRTEIDFSLPIGSSSIRRCIQLKELYENAQTKAVRGNVITRLEKLDRGEYSALILACAGLERLGMKERISRIFTEEEMLPACGQGIIAVQGRKGEEYDFIKRLDSMESRICAECERAFIKGLNGGCSSPTAAFAQIIGSNIILKGFYADEKTKLREKIIGTAAEGEKLGELLAERIKERMSHEG